MASKPTIAMANMSPDATSGGDVEAPDGLDEHENAMSEQEDRVHDRGEDLEAQVAIRALTVGGPTGEPDREQGESDARDVGEHVSSVGEEGQAVRRDAAGELDDEDADGDGEDRDQPPSMGGRGRRVDVWHQITDVERRSVSCGGVVRRSPSG